MTENLANWRNGCTPHRDIQENAVSEALFAVNLSRAIAREEPTSTAIPRCSLSAPTSLARSRASSATCSTR